MKCAWSELIAILPGWIGDYVDRYGRSSGQELRIRIGQPPVLVCKERGYTMTRTVTEEDLRFIVNTASQYSPWASESAAFGYITAPGGHRIGLCGEAIIRNGEMKGLRRYDSLCLRIARDFPGIAAKLQSYGGSILIIGPPGSGKTTLLRDLIRQKSHQGVVCVADERGELFPKGIYRGNSVDVLYAADKRTGLDVLLRTMSPRAIAVDEITSAKDAEALVDAAGCGVALMATAHGADLSDIYRRRIYQPIAQSHIFDYAVVLNAQQNWRVERIAV